MEYRIITFKTLSGNLKFVDLGSQTYGEWIIYEDGTPKYHISCLREKSESDCLIKKIIENNKWSIEKLLKQVNENEGRKFKQVKRPFFEIILSTEMEDLHLTPMPIKWIERIINGRKHADLL